MTAKNSKGSHVNNHGARLKQNWTGTTLFLLIIVIAIFLRFYDLGNESLWLDEASSLLESGLPIPEMSAHSNQPPLYFLLLAGWIKIWGTSEVALRSLSAVFGILSVVFMFLAGRELFNARTGLIGGFLAAISPFYIFHSQDTRAYSLLLLLSLVSYFVFISMLKKDRAWHYPLYFLATALTCYTHIYGFFILISQIAYLAIYYRAYLARIKKLAITFGCLGISVVPILLLLGSRALNMAGQGFWIPRPDIGQAFDTFAQYSAGFVIKSLVQSSGLDAFLGNTSAVTFYILTIIFIALAFSGFFLCKSSKTAGSDLISKKKQPVVPAVVINRRVLLLLWLFVTILLPFLTSLIITPFYLPRYTIGGSAAFYLMVAYPLGIAGRKTLYVLLAIITLLSSISLYNYYSVDIKEQWRDASAYVTAKSEGQDAIIFCEPYVQLPFDYYYKGHLPEVGIRPDASNENILLPFKDKLKETKRVWFVLSNVGKAPPPLTYLVNTFKLVEYKGYRGILVYLIDLSSK
jgi:mannosyltransferase